MRITHSTTLIATVSNFLIVFTSVLQLSCALRFHNEKLYGIYPKKTKTFLLSTITADEWDSFGIDRHEEFLEKYWQKRPLLIRQAFPDWKPLVTPDELAGLACADDVESRIIAEEVNMGEDGESLWEVSHGPFEEAVFEDLGDSHWTLLVQEASRHLPEISDLLNHPSFSFAPSWRMDDVMISYAPPNGSVGPHVDSYDVFLLQGSGTKEWSIEEKFVSGEEEISRNIEGLDLRVLRDFSSDKSWILQPGDMLYLPPRVPHHGVSLDNDCCTYSVGFRAPSERELLSLFADEVGDKLVSEFQLMNDPDLKLQNNPGEITAESISRAKNIIKKAFLEGIDKPGFFEDWFGRFVSSARHEHFGYPFSWEDSGEAMPYAWESPKKMIEAMKNAPKGASGPVLYRAEGLKFTYIHLKNEGCLLCIDGKSFSLGGAGVEFAQLICSKQKISPADLHKLWAKIPAIALPDMESFLENLVALGLLYPADM